MDILKEHSHGITQEQASKRAKFLADVMVKTMNMIDEAAELGLPVEEVIESVNMAVLANEVKNLQTK